MFTREANRMVWVVASILLSALAAGCGGSADDRLSTSPDAGNDSEITGHQRMVAILADIKSRAPAEHLYYGGGVQHKMREQFDRSRARMSKFEQAQSLSKIGYLEMLYEKTPDLAIQTLTQSYEMLGEIEFENPRDELFLANSIRYYLGVAYLRLGETENCCLRHSSESCILPIQGNGIHTQTRGSTQAIRFFREVLENTKDVATSSEVLMFREASRWLLNIAYMTLDEFPDKVPDEYRIRPEFFASEIEFPRFENVAPKLHLETFNAAGGAVVDDFDNDDYLDILTSSADPTIQMRLFRNNRDGSFVDHTEKAGLAGLFGGLNIVQGDYNNDGNVDVYILRGAWLGDKGDHPNSLLKNNGDGTFTDMTFEAGLGEVHYPAKTAAWADYDNDGDLDLFVGSEWERERALGFGRKPVNAPAQLFQNNGDGTFTDVAHQSGLQVQIFAMGSTWGDFNGDRFPDLFVSEWSHRRLYRNNRDGTFTEVTKLYGITRPSSPFATWFWDFDNDGALDLYVANSSGSIGVLALNSMTDELISDKTGFLRVVVGDDNESANFDYEMASLYRGDGQGGFEDVSFKQGLTYPAEPMGANFGDLNGDGFLDFYLATGDVPYWELRPNVMFLNQRGEKFANVTMGGGFGHLQKGHGVCFADIDHDGDQDVYVQMGGQLPGDRFNDALFENPGFDHHWVTIKLVGKKSNRSAIGARIKVTIVEDGKDRTIFRHVNSGGSFGCNPLRQNIGLGKADKIKEIEIYWPTSDTRQVFDNVEFDQSIEIVEFDDASRPLDLRRFVLGGE